jgi:hypothetical protein
VVMMVVVMMVVVVVGMSAEQCVSDRHTCNH